jgi:hypothetical protein
MIWFDDPAKLRREIASAYRPELAEAPRVYIVEGERDADTLAAAGVAATCNHGGAGRWREEHAAALVAAAVPEVVVLPDNDPAGEAHALAVARSCHAIAVGHPDANEHGSALRRSGVVGACPEMLRRPGARLGSDKAVDMSSVSSPVGDARGIATVCPVRRAGGRVMPFGQHAIPTCWPDNMGQCACGRGHAEKQIGKGPLVEWGAFVTTPPTEEQGLAWRLRWPEANRALLVEPAGVLVIDCDGDEALSEATALGLPPAVVAVSGRGRHYYFRAPRDVAGKSTTRRGRSTRIDVLAGGLVTIPPSRHKTGRVYEWIVGPAERALGDPPAWAMRWLVEATTTTAAAVDVRLPDELPAVHLETLSLSPRIRRLILEGSAPRYRSRSEAVFACVQFLIVAGYDDATIASVLEDPANGISAKPRELGRRWLAREIARARAKSAIEVFV